MESSSFEFSFETKEGTQPYGKPRINFTCHPADFDICFDRIKKAIFDTHDCVIYYTADMTMTIPRETMDVDLDRMNLFVIPVSLQLLTQPNRAMDVDYAFARKKHIPVLPIMVDEDIDELYSQPDKFGDIQYLRLYNTDPSEVSYQSKLKKYLDSVLIGKELYERIRNAFYAHVFLSYRKKDRRLANELMRLIHSDERCRNIAIWYDEFLTPGESFTENINHALKDSELFALLVTPSLLEEPNGKPNFVMDKEYPAARDSGKQILPTIMQETREKGGVDNEALIKKFKGLPECINADDGIFIQMLLDAVLTNAKRENEDNPVHYYYIGLAYLEGVDMEINREYALTLFERAHSFGLLDATKQLSEMYLTGNGVNYDVFKAAEYRQIALNSVRNTCDNTEGPKRLIEELLALAEICLSGKTERFEPSPGKLLSRKYAIELYIEAVELQEQIANSSQVENAYRSLCDSLSRLCNLLSASRSGLPQLPQEKATYFRKWVKYATYLGKTNY